MLKRSDINSVNGSRRCLGVSNHSVLAAAHYRWHYPIELKVLTNAIRNACLGLIYRLTLLIVAIPGCSRSYEFSGIVFDGNAVPITGATFAIAPLSSDESSQTYGDAASQEDGTFVTGWCCVPDTDYFVLATACEGYLDDVRIVAADATDIQIVLARNPSGNRALDMRELTAHGTRILMDKGAVRFLPDTEDGG